MSAKKHVCPFVTDIFSFEVHICSDTGWETNKREVVGLQGSLIVQQGTLFLQTLHSLFSHVGAARELHADRCQQVGHHEEYTH